MTIGKEIGRKLTVADLGYDKERLQEMVIANKNEKIFLARFVGVVTGLKPYRPKVERSDGETSDREFGLLGNFKATTRDGEVREGSVCYLPVYYMQSVIAAFTSADDIQSIQIAVDVYVEYDKDAATSYVFTVFDLLNTGSESVAEVEDSIKALPLPTSGIALEHKKGK